MSTPKPEEAMTAKVTVVPGGLLIELPFDLVFYPDLLIGEPLPLSPEERESFIAAMTEALVAAYRRQKNPLHPSAALA